MSMTQPTCCELRKALTPLIAACETFGQGYYGAHECDQTAYKKRCDGIDGIKQSLPKVKAALSAPCSPSEYPHNPDHPIGTCVKCGEEMVYNVPRMGPNGGFIHKATGKYECSPSEHTCSFDADGSPCRICHKTFAQTLEESKQQHCPACSPNEPDATDEEIAREAASQIIFKLNGIRVERDIDEEVVEEVILVALRRRSASRDKRNESKSNNEISKHL